MLNTCHIALKKYCLFFKIIISEWGVCFIPTFIFQTFTEHLPSDRPHANHWGYSFLGVFLSPCLSPAITFCIDILPGSDMPFNSITIAPKGLSPKQTILSFPVLSFTKYLLRAYYVPAIVLVEGPWQCAKQMLFQPSRELQMDRAQTLNNWSAIETYKQESQPNLGNHERLFY